MPAGVASLTLGGRCWFTSAADLAHLLFLFRKAIKYTEGDQDVQCSTRQHDGILQRNAKYLRDSDHFCYIRSGYIALVPLWVGLNCENCYFGLEKPKEAGVVLVINSTKQSRKNRFLYSFKNRFLLPGSLSGGAGIPNIRESFLSMIIFLSWFALLWVGLREGSTAQPGDGGLCLSPAPAVTWVWPWASPSTVLHVWLSSLALKKIFFPLCDCLGILQLSRNKRQLFFDEGRPDTAVPSFGLRLHEIHPSPG